MENLIAMADLAVRLRKSRASIYRMVADGRLKPVYRPSHPRSPLFRESDVAGLEVAKYREPAFDETLHFKARQAAGHACVICGSDWRLSAHHVIPVEQGGEDALENLIALCKGCHSSVHMAGKSLLKKAKKHGTTAAAAWLLASLEGK